MTPSHYYKNQESDDNTLPNEARVLMAEMK